MRSSQYDIVKGVAIILMVLCHAGCCQHVRHFIYLFHMPVFFIMAGWFYKVPATQDEIRQFILKKLRRLWFPFVAYGIFAMSMHNFLFQLGLYEGGEHPILGHNWSVQEMGSHIVKCLFMADGFYGLTGTFWFLRALFWGLAFYGVFDYLLRKRLGDKLSVAFLSFLACVMSGCSWVGNSRPICYVGGASMMTAFCLIHTGVLLRLIGFVVDGLCWQRVVAVVVICLPFLLGLGRAGAVNLDANEYPGLLVLLCCSVCGWYFFGGVARIIGGTRFGRAIAFVGQHTMPIFLFHFAAFKMVTVSGILLGHDGSVAAFPCAFFGFGWCLVYTFVGIIVPLLLWWLHSYFCSCIWRK